MKDSNLPQFIDNKPCGIDLFESGSHKRTADSISQHIKKRQSDYKLIGLEGEWGAGKSNVIKIIDANLGSDFHFFIYDAWSHQEDLQRRSFLEDFTENLQASGLLESNWEEKFKDLLAKKKETTTKTIPKLSFGIIIAIALTILTPILKSISECLPTNTGNIYKNPKWIIPATPLIVALAIAIGYIFYLYFGKPNKSLKDSFQHFFNSLIQIYKYKHIENTTTETISEKEPSIREFRKWMHRLSSDISDSKEVVIVFDNMDRLPPNKIQNLWSSIHTFFAEAQYERIWVIVPFDRTHIKKAFYDSDEQPSNPEERLTNHFINKTFPIIYRVSPLVLTDWKGFFDKKFIEAFGQFQDAELITIRNIFDLSKQNITPREIISFLNELVSLKMIWDDQIPLEYCAIYVLKKEQILLNPIGEIIGKTFLGSNSLSYASDEKVSDYIAALVYNIEPSKAIEITLQREIINAVRNKDDQKLSEYSTNNKFYEILESTFNYEQDWDIESATMSLSKLPQNEKNANTLSMIWNKIINKQLELSIDRIDFTERYKILLQKANDGNLEKLLRYYLHQFAKIENINGAKYYSTIREIEKFISKNRPTVDFEKNILNRTMLPKTFIEYIEAAKEKHSQYRVECNHDSLDTYLSTNIDSHFPISESIIYLIDENKFPKLTSVIENLIESDETKITIKNIHNIFSTYKILSNNKPLRKKISDDKIDELLDNSDKKSIEFYELIAMRVSRMGNFIETTGVSDEIVDSTEEILVNEVSKVIEYYIDYGDLIVQSIEYSKPLVIGLSKKLTLIASETSKLNITTALSNYDKIKDTIKLSDEQLLTKFNGWHEDISKSLNAANLKSIITNIGFYQILYDVNNTLCKNILKVACEYIKSINHDDWNNYFLDYSSYEIKLLHFLIKNDYMSNIPINGIESYMLSLIKMAENAQITHGDLKEWDLFYEKSDKPHLTSTVMNIRDSLIKQNNITPKQFLLFEKPLRELGKLEDRCEDVIRTIVTPNINVEECLNEIVMHSDFYVSLIYNSGDVSFGLIDKLCNKIESNENLKSAYEFVKKILTLYSNGLKIISANYHADESGIDVSKIIISKLSTENHLYFIVNNDILGGDPKVGAIKNLTIIYKYKNSAEQTRSFDENTWVRLP